MPVTKKVPLAPAALSVSTSVCVYWYGPSSNASASTPDEEHLVMTWPAAGPARLKASSGLGTGVAEASAANAETRSVEICMAMTGGETSGCFGVWKQMLEEDSLFPFIQDCLDITETSIIVQPTSKRRCGPSARLHLLTSQAWGSKALQPVPGQQPHLPQISISARTIATSLYTRHFYLACIRVAWGPVCFYPTNLAASRRI